MFALCRQATTIGGICGICVLALGAPSAAHAQGNVVIGFDALMVMNTEEAMVTGSNASFTGFGRFTYDGMQIVESPELGRFGAFEIRKDGAGGSGMGFNFTAGDANNPVNAGVVINNVAANMFPLLDRAGFGVNFEPSQYVAELVYKPLPTNNGDQLNLTLDTFDGFDSSGLRRAEQFQWNFVGLAAPTGTPDADGFYTVRSNGGSLSTANAGFDGPSHMFEIAPLPAGQEGDGEADFNDFEAFGPTGTMKVPNGARQIHLQTPYDDVSTADHFAIKALRIVKLNPDSQEVARMDGRSGFSLRFGSPFRRASGDPPINIDGTNYIPSEFNTFANTDQVSRFDENGFTNIVLKTHDANEVGGLGLYQPPTTQVFDGTIATVDLRARLTVAQGAGQADRIVLVLKDKDGNDTAPNQGGDEYHYELMLGEFNTASMTTVQVPLSDFMAQTAGEFVNAGDGLLSNFNLYYFGIETVTGTGAGLVNLEIESMRIMLPAPPGTPGDYNDDGTVDAADYVLWRKHNGTATTLPNDDTPGTGPDDYTRWVNNFGNPPGSSSAAGDLSAVPEPATCSLALLVLCLAATLRRRAQPHSV